jgi:hypothetical protein
MKPRPRVLIAIGPPLLADLVRRALEKDGVEVGITDGSQAAWDIVVVRPEGREHVRATHLVDLREIDGSEFESLIARLRALTGR